MVLWRGGIGFGVERIEWVEELILEGTGEVCRGWVFRVHLAAFRRLLSRLHLPGQNSKG